ncbi:MAG: S4 domain-containing protein [Betaproteobacteria bacterium]|nr:S4 domain-containing protein [Betaproteobacteria bacterium]
MRDDPDRLRIDKWLWAARFFKTRAAAAQACEAGKVKADGERVKPAKTVQVGRTLSIRIGPYEYGVVVRALSDVRGPAAQAARLYEETEASRQAREALALQLKADRASAGTAKGRPTKKARRQIIRFIGA